MRYLNLTVLFFLLWQISLFAETTVSQYEVVPLPLSIEYQNRPSFKLNRQTTIIYQAGHDCLENVARHFSDFFYQVSGLRLHYYPSERSSSNSIFLRINNQEGAMKEEQYRLSVNENHIEIVGASAAGVFYATQTLCKSVPNACQPIENLSFPAVRIVDFPRFSYRGMHLDVSRHLYTVDFIKRYIDILALHNINKLHWHLTDDQGWRIEIKGYPELTRTGSMRNQTVIGKNSGIYDGHPYGGFYTQNEIKEIVAYAQERFITIIPEIDMPGHMLAALTSYPRFGCTGGPYQVATRWGIFSDVICAGNDEALNFLENILKEVMAIFPSNYIHIGGDECRKTRWEDCPKCQARIKTEKLNQRNGHSPEENLQSFVIRRMADFLQKNGRVMIGWEEILQGGLAPNAVVMSWRGIKGGIKAAKQGHQVIMTPSSHLYFDYYQHEDFSKEPLAPRGTNSFKQVYSFEPYPSSLSEEYRKYIIGCQANLWTEYIPFSYQVEYMLMPRIAALSEVQWCQANTKNYDGLLKRMPQLIHVYDLFHYNYAKHILKELIF